MKLHRLLLLVLFGFSFLLVGFGPPRLIDHAWVPTQRLTVGQLRRQREAQQTPTLSASALLLYDVDAKRVLYTRQGDVSLPPASLTKLMTALLVLESASLETSLDSEVTIQSEDLIGGATMGLYVGERLTLEALLWGLLIPSGNDAAMAAARYVAGSAEAFVARMNQRAAELGLQQTNFVNPHGLDIDGHVSSVNDLLILVQQTLNYALFREIVATENIDVAGHLLHNTNQLLGTFPGATGIKTGTTPAAGECLIASIERDDHTILAILLGSQDRYADMRTLYATYEANHHWTDGNARQLSILNRIYDQNEQLWYLTAEGESPALLLSSWQVSTLRAFRRVQVPNSPERWQAGAKIGEIVWYLGAQQIGIQPLVLR